MNITYPNSYIALDEGTKCFFFHTSDINGTKENGIPSCSTVVAVDSYCAADVSTVITHPPLSKIKELIVYALVYVSLKKRFA